MLGQFPRFLPLGVCGTDAALTALVTAHLAYALNGRGLLVWVLDEAAAPHNVATCFGLPLRRSLNQALRQGASPDTALYNISAGLGLLAIHGGMPWLASLSEERWHEVIDALNSQTDAPQCLLLHAPHGAEAGSLAMCAHDRILVVPQGRTALTQSYALIKGVQRLYPSERWHVVVMQARDESSARATFTALASTAQRFLDIELHWLGSVPFDKTMIEAVRHMLSVQELSADRPGIQALRRVAETVAAMLRQAGISKPEEFWLKMWMFSRLTTEAVMEKTKNVQLS